MSNQKKGKVFSPHPGRQTQFLSNNAEICIYGGAAGGGKSHALLMEAIRHFHVPNFVAMYFRRTFPEITGKGGIWDRTHEIYHQLGGRPNNSDYYWSFPTNGQLGSESKIAFSHLQHDADKYKHQSAEYALVIFDELHSFLESQFWFLQSRNRTTCGVRPYIRAACNPDPDSFVKTLIRPWLDDEGRFPNLAMSGVVLPFVRDIFGSDELVWLHKEPERADAILKKAREEDPDFREITVSFIPASVDDNPSVKGYKSKLMSLPLIERQRLLYGDWKIKPAAGLFFKTTWFQMASKVPDLVELWRYWDRASTGESGRKDADYTAGILMGMTRARQWIVLDLIHFRGTPFEVKARVLATARSDNAQWGQVNIGIEQDPGAAGVFEADMYSKELRGFSYKMFAARVNKEKRAEPFSAAVQSGDVMVLNALWNEVFFNELESFPDGKHDDIVDSCSGCFTAFGDTLTYDNDFWENLTNAI